MKTKEQLYDDVMTEIHRQYDQIKEGAMLIPDLRDKHGRIVKGMKVPRTETVRLACDMLQRLIRVGTNTPEPTLTVRSQMELNLRTKGDKQ